MKTKTAAQMTKATRIDDRYARLGKTIYRWSDAADLWVAVDMRLWNWDRTMEALRMACRALPWHEFVLTYIAHMASMRGTAETEGKTVMDIENGRWSIGMADALARGEHWLVGDADGIYAECQRDYRIKRLADEADLFRYETLKAA